MRKGRTFPCRVQAPIDFCVTPDPSAGKADPPVKANAQASASKSDRPGDSKGEAAVDQVDLPGGEGALVGGEIDRERGHFLRLAQAAHRLAVDEGLADRLDRLAARAAQRLDAAVER